jgi:hypothetical protein
VDAENKRIEQADKDADDVMAKLEEFNTTGKIKEPMSKED